MFRMFCNRFTKESCDIIARLKFELNINFRTKPTCCCGAPKVFVAAGAKPKGCACCVAPPVNTPPRPPLMPKLLGDVFPPNPNPPLNPDPTPVPNFVPPNPVDGDAKPPNCCPKPPIPCQVDRFHKGSLIPRKRLII